MRHSTIYLTMNVYTDPKLLDVHGALDSLPDLPLDQRNRSAMRATGTDASDALAPVLAPNSGVYGASGSFPVKATPRDKQPSIAPSIDVTSDAVRRNNPLTSPVSGCQMSGRQDLNLQPSGPKPDALAKLSYAPEELRLSLGRNAIGVNGGVEPEVSTS